MKDNAFLILIAFIIAIFALGSSLKHSVPEYAPRSQQEYFERLNHYNTEGNG